MRIHNQHATGLTDADRLELAKLLIKAGYTVRIGKTKEGNRTVGYVEALTAKTAAGES